MTERPKSFYDVPVIYFDKGDYTTSSIILPCDWLLYLNTLMYNNHSVLWLSHYNNGKFKGFKYAVFN